MSIEYQTPSNQIRRIRQGDPDFILTDDWAQHPRASLEITNTCPTHVSDAIRYGFTQGYIKLTAAVYDHELVWEKLGQ